MDFKVVIENIINGRIAPAPPLLHGCHAHKE